MYEGSPYIYLGPIAISGTLATYSLPNFSQIGREIGFSFLSLFLLNQDSYRVEILYEGSHYNSLGHAAVRGALAVYYLQNLSQIEREMGFELHDLVSP